MGKRRRRERQRNKQNPTKAKAAQQLAAQKAEQKKAVKPETPEAPEMAHARVIGDAAIIFDPIPDDILPSKDIDPGLPCQSRMGQPVYILDIDPRRKDYPIRAFIGMSDKYPSTYTRQGSFSCVTRANNMDIFNISLEKWEAGIKEFVKKQEAADI